jgi:hypothetical protein
MAGRESVIRFIHNNWLASNGTGQKNKMEAKMVITSPRLQDSKKITAFLILF